MNPAKTNTETFEYSSALEQPVSKAPSLQNADVNQEHGPQNWSHARKYYVVLLISSFAFMAQLGSAMIFPSFVRVAEDLDVTVEEASYSVTLFILVLGVFPLFIAPFSRRYGRRPLYLVFTPLSIAGFVVSAVPSSWGTLIAGRIIGAVGCSIPLAIGAASICDMFAPGERGLPMGIYAWATTNGPHIAPIAGGYIAQRYGWRWCNWISAIIEGGLLILAVFTFPETLVSNETAEHDKISMWRSLKFCKAQGSPIGVQDFLRPVKLIKFAAITLPCIMYMVNLSYGSPLFAVTGSFICSKFFHFNIEQTGNFLGLPLTVGCILGELSAGWVSDLIMNMYARRHGGYQKAEARLYLLPLVLFTSIGTATFGFCIQQGRPWIQAAVCMAVAGFGSQIVTTVTYTYCCDSYREHASDVGIVINLFKGRKSLQTRSYLILTKRFWVLCSLRIQRRFLCTPHGG